MLAEPPCPADARPIRVILADDHPILRSGLRLLLGAEPDLEVVGEANNGLEAVEQTTRLRPDVVVMDIAMPGMSGLEATRRISQLDTGARVLILTVHAEEQYLLPVVQAGGSGYVLKSQADTDLLEAIRAVHRGEVFLDPPAQKMLLEDYLSRVKAGKEVDSYQTLSEREREVLKLTAEGYTAQEIADQLVLSPKTVDTYRARVMDKLNLHHRAELVKYALRKGLLQPGERAASCESRVGSVPTRDSRLVTRNSCGSFPHRPVGKRRFAKSGAVPTRTRAIWPYHAGGRTMASRSPTGLAVHPRRGGTRRCSSRPTSPPASWSWKASVVPAAEVARACPWRPSGPLVAASAAPPGGRPICSSVQALSLLSLSTASRTPRSR